MFCTHCGSPLDPGHAFCTTCGTRRPVDTPPAAYCTHCGAPLDAAHSFCTRCGTPRGGTGPVLFVGATGPVGGARGLRPLGVAERLDAAIKSYFATFAQMVRVLALIAVPFGVLQGIIAYSSGQYSQNSLTTTQPDGTVVLNTGAVWTRLAGDMSSIVMSSVVTTIAITTVALIVGAWYVGSPVGWRDALRRSVRRLPSSLAFLVLKLLLLCGLIAAVVAPTLAAAVAHVVPIAVLVGIFGSLAAFATFLWLDTSWKATVPSIMLEDLRVFSAMRRSYRLVKGAWWSVFGTVFLASVLVSVVSGFFSVGLVGVIVSGNHSATVVIIVAAITSVAQLIVLTPFSAAVNVVIAIDLRVRKEGLDLELLARQVDVPATPSQVNPGLTWGSGFPTLPPDSSAPPTDVPPAP